MSKKTIIVHGPQGCGKTTNGEKLRKAFKLDAVREFDDYLMRDQPEGKPLRTDTLYLTCMEPDEVLRTIQGDFQLVAFDDAMRRVV
jgi:uridine kinase